MKTLQTDNHAESNLLRKPKTETKVYGKSPCIQIFSMNVWNFLLTFPLLDVYNSKTLCIHNRQNYDP